MIGSQCNDFNIDLAFALQTDDASDVGLCSL